MNIGEEQEVREITPREEPVPERRPDHDYEHEDAPVYEPARDR